MLTEQDLVKQASSSGTQAGKYLNAIQLFEPEFLLLEVPKFGGAVVLSKSRGELYMQSSICPVVVVVHSRDRPNPPTIQSDGDPEQSTQFVDQLPMVLSGQIAKVIVLLFGWTFAMIAGNVGDDLDFCFGVPQEFTIPDQIVRMFVVVKVADEVTAVMENCCGPEQFSFGLSPIVENSLGRVK
jgi:hypothetical protein